MHMRYHQAWQGPPGPKLHCPGRSTFNAFRTLEKHRFGSFWRICHVLPRSSKQAQEAAKEVGDVQAEASGSQEEHAMPP